MQAGPHCGKTLVSVKVLLVVCFCGFSFVCFFFFNEDRIGCPLLILVAVKHKFKLMHVLTLFLKRPVYLNLGLRPFS